MNPIQKNLHIIESYACILRMLGFMVLLLIIVLISFGICYTPKLSKYVTLLLLSMSFGLASLTHKATQLVPISEYSSRFLIYIPSFTLGKLSLE